ncbi:MAG: tetratricopeptide repeat protein [bacterium]|nr:tetratricopeptide repeat protein [bacterium]
MSHPLNQSQPPSNQPPGGSLPPGGSSPPGGLPPFSGGAGRASLFMAEVMIGARQYAAAETMLRTHLASSPNDGAAHSLLALALIAQEGKVNEANLEADRGIRFAPTDSYAHYVKAFVKWRQRNTTEALSAIREAIRLNAQDARYHTLAGQVYLFKGSDALAIDAAHEALRLAPEDGSALTILARALLSQKRYDEAEPVIANTLQLNPQDADAYVSRAILHIKRHQYPKASEDFRQALRIDPQSPYAEEMLIETMKGRNPVYALMLRYYQWSVGLSPQARWGLLIGGVIGLQVASSTLSRVEGGSGIVTVLFIAYYLFVFLSWTAVPLFDVLLRFDKFGSQILPPDRKLGANVVGIALLIAIGLGVAGLFSSGVVQRSLWIAAAQTAGLILPIAAAFNAEPGSRARRNFLIWAAVLALFIPLGYTTQPGSPSPNNAVSLYIFGLAAFTWVGNVVAGSVRAKAER